MILAWAFWLLLLAPGACLFLRLRPADQPASGFETIAVGYLLSFLVLAPVCIIGHALVLPLWVLSTAIVLAVVGGLGWLARDIRRGALRWSFDAAYAGAALVIALLLIHAAALGGHVTNDADFHLARIRLLYDHGLTNADPMTGTGFSHPYHTNILHALVAAGSRLTGLDPIVFWQATLPWAKLLAGSSVATLCLRLGGTPLAAWVACLFQLGTLLRIDWALYPNQIAPFWLIPTALAGCIGLFASAHTRYYALLIGSGALMLGLVHGLYAGFFALLGAAVIGAVFVYSAVARTRPLGATLRLALLGAILLSVSGPSLYVARYAHLPAQTNFDYQGGEAKPRVAKPGRYTRSLRADDEGRFHLPARRLLSAQQSMALLALVVLLARRRFVEALGIGASLGACILVLHVPQLASAAVRALGSAWMLERLLDVVSSQQIALASAGLIPALSGPRWTAYAAGCIPIGAAIVAALLASGGLTEGARSKVLETLAETERLQVLTGDVPEGFAADQAVLRRVPAGSVVFTHPLAARQLRKLHDLRFLRASRNHTGVDDLLDRTVDLQKLQYAKGLTPEVRVILDRWGIRYGVLKSAHPVRWLKSQPEVGASTSLGLTLVELVKPYEQKKKKKKR
jgi:hypothetical protein